MMDTKIKDGCQDFGQLSNVGQGIGGQETAETAPVLLKVEKVAKILDISVRTIWRMANGGKMPAPVRIGHIVRWSRLEIMEWIAAGCPHINGA